MAPLATLCHSAVSIAVGLAAKRRKADGSTPSTAASDPFTRTRAASTGSAARTPGSPRTLATVPAGSGSSDDQHVGWQQPAGGRRRGDLPPAGSALGGRPGCGGTSAMAGGVAPPGRGMPAAARGEPAATTSSEPAAIRTGRPAPRSLRPAAPGGLPGRRRPRTRHSGNRHPQTRILRTRIPRPMDQGPAYPRTNIPRACQDGPGYPGTACPLHHLRRHLPTPGCLYPPAGHHYPAGAGAG